MYKTGSDKFFALILDLLSKYLIWIIVLIVIFLWYYLPNATEAVGQIVFFWAPTISLVAGFIVAISRNKFRAKKDEKEGITQYEIMIHITEIYLMDLIVYGGSVLILFSALVFNENGINAIDLLQALIYFVFSGAIRQMIYKKTLK